MDVVCAKCQLKVGEKEGEGISHTICEDCAPGYLEEQGLSKQEVAQFMAERRLRNG